MFIERIDVERFGALSGVVIDRLGPGVQVLHGTNEVGKTTLLEFVRAVFFGFEGQFRRGVLDPQRPCAGRLVVRVGPERVPLAIERRHEGPHLAALTRAAYTDDVVGLGGDEGDLVRITDLGVAGDAPRHRVYLQDLVGGIDETTFTNVMAFGLDELHELRTLEPEGCGSRLYELASGLDRSKVARVLAHLRDAIARLDSSDPAVSPIRALETRRRDLEDRLAALGAPALAAGGLWMELAHLDAEIAAIEARIAEALRAEEVVRRVLPLEALHAEWRRTAERLAALEAAPLVHPDRDAWRSARRRLRRAERLAASRKKRRGKYARQLAELPGESAVWRKRAAVAALVDDQPRLERIVADVSRAEAHARLAARRFGEQVGVAGLSRLVPAAASLDADIDALPDVLLPEGFAQSFGPLRARARDCATTAREAVEAKRDLDEARRALDETRGLVKGGGATPGSTTADALAAAAERTTSLRRRITLGDQLAELDRAAARLEHDVADGLAGQLIPGPWLVALGTLFAVGAGMLLSGLLLPASVTGSMAYALAALGLAGTGVASVTTWSLDRGASVRLDAARRQLDTTRRQRADVAAQCGQLDAALGADAAAALDRRLAAAQAELDRLEELAAREGSVHVLSDRVALAEQALARATEARSRARGRWRSALERRGLPPNLSPREVRQIARHRHTLLVLDDDRRRLSEEARRKREEVATFARKIDELLVECEILPEATPLDHLRILQERLDAERATMRKRATLERKLESARRRHRHMLRQVRVAGRAVEEFYARWGVAGEPEFLAKVDRRPEHEAARRDAEMAETAWLDARRRTTEPADLDRWLDERGILPLEKRLADACAVTAAHRQALAAARDRRKAASARVEAAARDHAGESLQGELAGVEEQLAAQHHRRALLERSREILEETRAVVARDHQPPVLREASRWLARLTDGRYPSITTAIDEARLEVHEADGSAWDPERLSRGTREQVFLALRLALIRDLGRHDVSLPVVMDDALVNFDDARARLAARVLVEFIAEQAAGRQMLVLTCHEHVAAIFRAAGAHVRSLGGAEPPPALPPAPPVRIEPVRVVHVAPAPRAPEPEPEPLPPGAWPAEVYFFGPHARATPHSPPSADDDQAKRPSPRRRRSGGGRPRRR